MLRTSTQVKSFHHDDHSSSQTRLGSMPVEIRNGATRPARRTSYELARERQSIKIRELREALVMAGCRHLDAQACALGLSRSTTWSILQANHKRTGISARVIKRMLDQPGLPSSVRARILEYVDEKSAGTYGHKGTQLRRFAAALTREP